ncbi:MAG: hypothetical protein ACRBB6_03115 [Neptuniibacter sp.]
MMNRLLLAAAFQKILADIEIVESGSGELGDTPLTFANTLQEKDFVLLHYIDVRPNSITHPAGYAINPIATLDNEDIAYYAYKVMGATPDTSFNMSASEGADGLAFTYYVLRNVNTDLPFAVISTESTTDVPASISPTTKSLVITSFFASGGANSSVSNAPIGFSGLEWFNASAGNDALVASAYKALANGATEDPGTFTRSRTHNDYQCITHAIQPKEGV